MMMSPSNCTGSESRYLLAPYWLLICSEVSSRRSSSFSSCMSLRRSALSINFNVALRKCEPYSSYLSFFTAQMRELLSESLRKSAAFILATISRSFKPAFLDSSTFLCSTHSLVISPPHKIVTLSLSPRKMLFVVNTRDTIPSVNTLPLKIVSSQWVTYR